MTGTADGITVLGGLAQATLVAQGHGRHHGILLVVEPKGVEPPQQVLAKAQQFQTGALHDAERANTDHGGLPVAIINKGLGLIAMHLRPSDIIETTSMAHRSQAFKPGVGTYSTAHMQRLPTCGRRVAQERGPDADGAWQRAIAHTGDEQIHARRLALGLWLARHHGLILHSLVGNHYAEPLLGASL